MPVTLNKEHPSKSESTTGPSPSPADRPGLPRRNAAYSLRLEWGTMRQADPPPEAEEEKASEKGKEEKKETDRTKRTIA